MEEQKSQGMAVGSMVCGIVGLVLSFVIWGIILGIIAVILGHIHNSNIKKQPDLYTGGGMAVAGLVTGYISIGLVLLFILFAGAFVAAAL
tara:strand:- start:4582 stop:4851 length:270 start_codon:yes stop_codon:yes gene_type:complete